MHLSISRLLFAHIFTNSPNLDLQERFENVLFVRKYVYVCLYVCLSVCLSSS